MILFGVYSVSTEAQAYPLSKAPPQSAESAPVKDTRSNTRENKKTQNYNDTSSSGPLSPGTHNLSIGIGQTFLLGDLGNRYENALGMDLNYTYGVSDLFSFETDFGYSSHSGSSGQFSASHLTVGVRTNLVYFDQLVPYFDAGVGFYRPSYTYPGYTLNGLLFGIQMGGGVDLLISKNLFFGPSLTYNNMFTSTKTGSDNLQHELGGAFISFLVHVGMTF